MHLVRVVLLLCVSLVVIAPQCSQDGAQQAQPAPAPAPAQPATLYGVVRGSPPKGMPPSEPATLGSTVPDAMVALRRFASRDSIAGDIEASTRTDSLGAYRLEIPAGTYFLVVSQAAIPYSAVTQGFMDKNFAPEDSIQTYRIVEIAGEQEENIVIPQRWPQ